VRRAGVTRERTRPDRVRQAHATRIAGGISKRHQAQSTPVSTDVDLQWLNGPIVCSVSTKAASAQMK
jgi:hypothetical protein